MLHRLSYILLICFLAGSAFGQYPATGNKSRLGWQTTADGLVWRGAIGDTATIDPVGLLQAWALVDTASGVLYQYRGKAWRPVLAYAIQPFDSIVFNNNEEDADSAELKYNADIGSLVYGANDGAQIPVLPGHWYVRNDTSVTLTKGTLVRASGTLGASGRIKAKHMIADNSIPAEYILGIVVKDIPPGEDGYVMHYGKIRKLNTAAYSAGDLLYPNDAIPGTLTNGAVYFKTPIAFVINSDATQGVIAVRINPENYLSRLHDVTLPGLAAQNILRYNGQYWIPGRDTSVYDFDARLKGNRTVLMNNFDMKFRNQYSENNYVQIRPTFVMVSDSTTGEQVALNKYGIAGPVTGGYLSEVRLANGVYLNGSNSRFIEGLDTGDGYDVTIDTVGRVRFRVSASGPVDSLYGKNSSGELTTTINSSALPVSSSTGIINVAEVVVDALGTGRLPWDGQFVVGVLKTGLYLTMGANGQFVQHELIPNGDKGDITTSAGGATMTIDAGAVTNSKANFTTLTAQADTAAQLLGVTTDGRPNTIGLAGGLTLTNGFLTVTGLAGGTVTSVQGGNGIITDPAGGITAAGTVSADTSVLASKVWANNALALKLNAADTASLSSRIDLKLNIADTAAMLSNYVNAVDTAAMLLPYLRKADTLSMLSTYINAADTAAMLLPYLKKADTTAMLTNYINFADTATLIATKANVALKLNIADTSAMLVTYINREDTAAMLLPYLRKADTLAMLSTYVNFTDTASMLSTYINASDTASMLTNYINVVDTASMLTNYINVVDTASMLTNYINAADTAAMLSQYVNFVDTVSIIATKKDVVITDNAVRDRERHYVHLTVFKLKDTVTNNFENSDFFVVPSDLQGWCIRTMQSRVASDNGTLDLELIVNGVTEATLTGITTSGAVLTPSSIAIAANNIVTLKTTNLSGTAIGLTATIQIQKTCN